MHERPFGSCLVHLCLLVALSLLVHSQNFHLSVQSLHCFFTLPTCNYMIKYSFMGFILFMLVKIPFLVIRVRIKNRISSTHIFWTFCNCRHNKWQF